MEKVSALWALFRKGEAVANPAAWHNGQVTANVLGGIIICLIKLLAAFGHPLPMDENSADSLGAGILVVVNFVFSVTGSPHVGLPAKPDLPNAEEAEPAAAGVRGIDQATIDRAEKWQRGQR